MYLVLVYSGGIYKFDEFVEFVEDLGGLVLKKDSFHISRGDYYLGEDIRALTIIPSQEKEKTQQLAQELKGRIENLEMENDEKSKILSCLVVYDLLSNSPNGMGKEKIKELLDCPCSFHICDKNDKKCYFPNLEEILKAMVDMDLLNIQDKNGIIGYFLKMKEEENSSN